MDKKIKRALGIDPESMVYMFSASRGRFEYEVLLSIVFDCIRGPRTIHYTRDEKRQRHSEAIKYCQLSPRQCESVEGENHTLEDKRDL